jgi:hypothetical protein
MTDQDKEHLEALYAGFAMLGFLMNGDYTAEEIPSLAKKMATAMMEPETTVGLPAIKRKAKAK